MADNVGITPGSGATIAADDIGGVMHQRMKVSVGADGAATDLAFGQATMANSLPVVIASDQSDLPTKEKRSSTPSQSSPSMSNSSASILASNTSRLGATIYNEGAAVVYVKLGTTASTTSYTVQLGVNGYYEVPFGYTGAIDGITASGTATLRVTELT